MDHSSDLLDRVVAELAARSGDLARVAKESGLSYDTVLRIKNRENDPGYSKVRALANYLFPLAHQIPAANDAPTGAAA